LDKNLAEQFANNNLILVKKFLVDNKVLQKLPKKYSKKQKILYFQRLKREAPYTYILMKRHFKIAKSEFKNWRNKAWLGKRGYKGNYSNINNQQRYNENKTKNMGNSYNNKIINIYKNYKVKPNL
jgi:hypothetical protein